MRIGLNVDRGRKICLRLRYPGDKTQFLPLEQVADTMLHELAHNVHGPHDEKFHALWNKLRDEHMSLSMKGYTGEGFLSEGHRLGGRTMPMEEARRIARVAAEKRRTLNASSGRRLGGAAPHPGQDIRRVISNAAERRNRTLRGCANENQTQDEIIEIADTATRNGFRTQAEEDAANDAAIAQALWEMVQEEERAKAGSSYIPPGAGSNGYDSIVDGRNKSSTFAAAAAARPPQMPRDVPRQDRGENRTWTCSACTLVNPENYLCCDACGSTRSEKPMATGRTVIDLTQPDQPVAPRTAQTPSSKTASKRGESRQAPPQSAPARSESSTPRTWMCHFCGRVRENQWWSCDLCGNIKLSS